MLYDVCGTGVWPDKGVGQGFSGIRVPDHRCFSLIGDTYPCYVVNIVPFSEEFLGCVCYAVCHGIDYFFRIVFEPSALVVV